jgi:hypothetical protein
MTLALPEAAAAQAPPVARSPGEAAPPSAAQCAPSRIAPEQGTITIPGTTTGQSGAPRSDQLARSDGVLCPPAGVDSEMRIPAPDLGTTPVIPPPAPPQNRPDLQPK